MRSIPAPGQLYAGHRGRAVRSGSNGSGTESAQVAGQRMAGLAVCFGSWICFLGGAAFLVLAFSYADVRLDLHATRGRLAEQMSEATLSASTGNEAVQMLARMVHMLQPWLVGSGSAVGLGLVLWGLGWWAISRQTR